MGTPQEEAAFLTKTNPLHDDNEQDDQDGTDDYEDVVPCGCDCLHFFRFNKQKHGLHPKAENGDSWWVNKLKKVKEISESLAGPKFKTLIRKISGYCKNKKQKNKFQYDAQSYALNFDSGVDREDDSLRHGFSARFAPPSSYDR
ncbi:hypothetical protein CFOL_v3_17376 [Cephalotus follicularis]|uniref:Uncharacterized protein n=1 Tax=Cephalotus follicularis TaxID=3775 RepID=A0A1Q3C1I6_CEPFO|nr:hypothetical protein CFOL_v3_17376 [Cephalotus follicularis]